jgi:16S rRNA processing protein RimM
MSDGDFSRIVGVIGKPHGLKGYVFIQLVTSYPDTIKKGDLLYTDIKCENRITVEDIKRITVNGKKRVVFRFAEHKDTGDLEFLRNKIIYRKKKDAPLLEKNTFWIEDLIGCKVYLSDKMLIGRVTGVENYAYNDNLILENQEKKQIIIPMLGCYIENVDTFKKEIILKNLPEYF